MVALMDWQIRILTLDLYPGGELHVHGFACHPTCLPAVSQALGFPHPWTPFSEKDSLDHGIFELQGTLVSKHRLVQGVPNQSGYTVPREAC